MLSDILYLDSSYHKYRIVSKIRNTFLGKLVLTIFSFIMYISFKVDFQWN
jgi:hypothetical protein